MFDEILRPFKAFKLKYLPVLTVYFATGFSIFYAIAETFWKKNVLTLSAEEIVAITIWTNLPWSLKILFSQLLNSVRICGSQRKIYIYIGAISMVIGNGVLIATAHQSELLLKYASTYQLLILAGLFTQVGAVLQDLVADTLCYELVTRQDAHGKARLQSDIDDEIAIIQILSRYSEVSGAVIATFISGYIAAYFPFEFISYFVPLVNLTSIIGVIVYPYELKIAKEPVNRSMLIGGLIYILVIILTTLSGFKYSQDIIFLTGLSTILVLIFIICRDESYEFKKQVFALVMIIFAFRISPAFGPGVEWWQIDELGYTPEFFGHLRQISIVPGLLGLWFFSSKLAKMHVGKALFLINTANVLFKLPTLAMAYGFHHWTMSHFGFGAKTIALIDEALDGPFTKLGFLVICIAATRYAPKKNLPGWFALIMGVSSVSLVTGSRILKKYLASIYVVERGDYHNIPGLIKTTVALEFFIPAIIIVLCSPLLQSKKQ